MDVVNYSILKAYMYVLDRIATILVRGITIIGNYMHYVILSRHTHFKFFHPGIHKCNTQNKIPKSQNKIPNAQNKIPNTQNKIPNTQNKIPNTQNKIPNTQNKIPNAKNKIPNTQNKILNAQNNFQEANSF